MTTSNIDDIYSEGKHYDRLFGEPNIPFWIEQAKQHGDPILELGCGTGKITIPLAKQKFRMTGLDLSSAMVTWAREKSKHEGVTVEWIEGDMRDFVIGEFVKILVVIPRQREFDFFLRSCIEHGFRAKDSTIGRLAVVHFS